MTLRRKNLASHKFLIGIYAMTLFWSGIIANPECQRGSAPNGVHLLHVVWLLTNIVAVLRTGPRLPVIRILQDNKFLLWISMYVLLETVIRPCMEEPLTPARIGVLIVSYAAMLLNGFHKHRKERCAAKGDKNIYS